MILVLILVCLLLPLLLLLFRFLSVRMCFFSSTDWGISFESKRRAVVRRQWRQKDWRRTALILLIYSLFSFTFRSLFTTTHTTTLPNSMFYMSIKCLPFSVILLNDKYGKATKFTVISIQTSYDLSDLYYYAVCVRLFWILLECGGTYEISCAMEEIDFLWMPQSKYFLFLWIFFTRFEWISSLLWWRQNWNSRGICINWNTNGKIINFASFALINLRKREWAD